MNRWNARRHGANGAGLPVQRAALAVVETLEKRSLLCGGAGIHDSIAHVGVIAGEPLAVESDGNAGTFIITRSGGKIGQPLNVKFVLGGTAEARADFEPISGAVRIPAGAYSAEVKIAPAADGVAEEMEHVILSLRNMRRYNLGDPSSAAVYIADAPGAELPPQTYDTTSGPARALSTSGPLAAVGALAGIDINGSGAGSTTVVSEGVAYDLLCGGGNILGQVDGFRFQHEQRAGDFDVQVKVDSLNGAAMAKAGLMARAGLEPNAKNIFVAATRSEKFRVSYRAAAGSPTSLIKSGAVNFSSDVWLRLRRSGNTFTAFRSTNGADWTQIRKVTMALPSTVHLGMAVTSAAASGSTAAFREYGNREVNQPGPVQGSDFEWKEVAAAKEAVSEGNGIAHNGRLYVFGGYYNRAQQASKLAHAYNPETNSWTRLADMPTNRHHIASAASGNSIYMVAGYNGDSPGVVTNSVWRYDINSNSYSEMPALPEVRGAGAAAVVNGTLHYFGGTNERRYESNEEDHWALDLSNPGAGWQRKADLPNARNHLAGVALDGKIYAIGGMDMDNGRTGQHTAVHMYDPATNAWTSRASLPFGISHHHAFVAGGRIFVLGGQVNSDSVPGIQSDKNLMYDPGTDTWNWLTPLPGARKSPITGFIGNRLIAATGNQGNTVPTTTTWSAVLPNSWERAASLPAAMTELRGAVIGNKIYVAGEGSGSTYAYDLGANTWEAKAARPYKGAADDAEHAAETVGGRLYLFGGLDNASQNKVQIYDPVSNSWSAGANQPFNAGSSNSAAINGEIYIAGGAVKDPDYRAVGNVAKYTPATNSWTPLQSMPLPRHAAASGTDGQKLYVFGGRDRGLEASSGTDTVQVFDPATNSWTTSEQTGGPAAIPRTTRGHVKAIYFKGEFYLFGGETSFTGEGATSDLVFNRVDIYNPTTNTWRRGPDMPTARHAVLPIYHAGRAYIIGGGVVRGTSSSKMVEVLNLI